MFAVAAPVPELGRQVILALLAMFIVLWVGKILFELLQRPIKARTELMLVVATIWFGYMARPWIEAKGVILGLLLFVWTTLIKLFIVLLGALGAPVNVGDLLPK